MKHNVQFNKFHHLLHKYHQIYFLNWPRGSADVKNWPLQDVQYMMKDGLNWSAIRNHVELAIDFLFVLLSS
jgi:hypothetical protein